MSPGNDNSGGRDDDRDGDDLCFANEMAQLGVTPLDGRRVSSAPESARAARPENRHSGQKSGRARRAGGRAKQAQPTRPTPSRPAPITGPELAELRAQLQAAEAERDALRSERVALERRFERERASLTDRWHEERDKLTARARDAGEQLARAEATLAGWRSLRTLLQARGCTGANEALAVMRGLLELRPDELLDGLGAMSAEPLVRLLEQRVAFVADGVEFDGGDSCVIVRVPAKRCEVTGGSDIQAGFRRLTAACARVGIQRVTIVGGSPAYRRQLQRLVERQQDQKGRRGAERDSPRLRLNLVSGTQRRTRKRADADVRNSDLIVIWGATELDHSVTSVYQSAPKKTLRVPHRGISRMLLQAAEELGKRA